MDFVFISLASLLAAGLTLFSGFGLGTLLMPAFALFFPLQAAIAMTALVHLANNLFAVALLGKDADWRIVVRFAMIAAPAAVLGAWALTLLGRLDPIALYSLWGRERSITLVKLAIAAIVGVFAILELAEVISDKPARSDAPRDGGGWLALGAALSGFFGGLSGHQGAIRSAFLVRAGLTKDSFIATAKVSAVAIDVARLAIYAVAVFGGAAWFGKMADSPLSRLGPQTQSLGATSGGQNVWGLVTAACLAAFLGSFLGAKLVRKVTMRQVRAVVGVALVLFALAIGAGVV